MRATALAIAMTIGFTLAGGPWIAAAQTPAARKAPAAKRKTPAPAPAPVAETAPATPPAQQPEAQEAQDEAAASNLDLPKSVTLLGKRDPFVRKATAIVNGSVITETDVDQRLALVLAANPQQINDQEKARLRLQVLSNLIDETLEIQEAASNKITIDQAEIGQTYGRIAQQFKMPPAKFAGYLREKGSSEASIKRQIQGEMSWRRVLGREVEPFVNVSDDEVNQVIDRLKASKGAAEYHVAEIYLSATPNNIAQVTANADRIVEQIRKGASFIAYAHEYSEASTKAVGGDLGWVRAEQLPPELSAILPGMEAGQLSTPIPVSGGFSILLMIDKRQVLTADPLDATLALKQLTIAFAKDTTRDQIEPKLKLFTEGLKALQGCGKANDLAASVGATVVDNDQIRIRDLPAQLRPIMMQLRVGEATPPFGSSEEGSLRALVVCGRDEPQGAELPTFDQIQSQMEEERVNLRARRYLRDLRRDAVIDYR